MNSATDIARYLVQKFIDIGKPTTNLKLQKLLYYAWIDYYKKQDGDRLFNDKIMAWRLGPVIEDVYREYRVFANVKISFTKKPENEIDKKTKKFLDEFAIKHQDDSVSTLIQKTHAEGKPWATVYKEGTHDIEIPFESIVELECQK